MDPRTVVDSPHSHTALLHDTAPRRAGAGAVYRSTTAVPPHGPHPASRTSGGVHLWGCHGGAGVTTLALAGVGYDRARLPLSPTSPISAPAGLVMVTRMSAKGMRAASEAVEAWQSGGIPDGVHVLGLAVVAAGPGRRRSRLTSERLGLMAAWFPAIWRVPWMPKLLDVDPDDLVDFAPLRQAIPHELLTLAEARA